MNKEWEKATKWEKAWWDYCVNTYGEETKQLIYAQKMGLIRSPNLKTPYRFDLSGRSVLDIGGGPVSLLLKCEGFKKAKVIDPIDFPNWVWARYASAGIDFEQNRGENIKEEGWDEVWLYNVLPHTENPELIIQNARKAGKLIRIFEWVNTRKSAGHPASFSPQQLDKWLGGKGKVELFSHQIRGQAYYGIFPTTK